MCKYIYMQAKIVSRPLSLSAVVFCFFVFEIILKSAFGSIMIKDNLTRHGLRYAVLH